MPRATAQRTVAKKPELTLRVRAMRYLARREHSRTELRAKLLLYAQEGDDVEAVLDELTQRNWLSDARAAQMLVNTKRSRFGVRRIAHELKQNGIGDDLISTALVQLKQSELETARAVWQKKFGVVAQDEKEKSRQVRFLQMRGFSLDVIFKVLRETE